MKGSAGMIKYVSYAVTFAEVPDEVCLTIQISNCPHRCEGCHSAYLQKDIGDDLERDLPDLLEKYQGRVTCVCFMGTGKDMAALARCVSYAKSAGFRTALYSGYTDDEWLQIGFEYAKDANLLKLFANLDYLKTGPYIPYKGGLDSKITNQRMYRMTLEESEDITERFWQKGIKE